MIAPLTVEEFSEILSAHFAGELANVKAIAVGLSGGPDSMVLTKLLSLWAEKNSGPEVHALTVDHGLRVESTAEAAQVAEWAQDWSKLVHNILSWQGEQSKSRIQEEARSGRYDLMAGYCQEHGIRHLFLAHHQDDQAETFLFRLAKGSGLDGLAAMSSAQVYSDRLTLLRPFLDIPKERLLDSCMAFDLSYIEDPSNELEKFARPRLRKSADVLAGEGLTSKRLAVTAKRLARAKEALSVIAQDRYSKATLTNNKKHIVLKLKVVHEESEEIGLRIILLALKDLRPEADYAPRMEKVEGLFKGLMDAPPFRKRTLGGLIFERDDEKGHIILSQED